MSEIDELGSRMPNRRETVGGHEMMGSEVPPPMLSTRTDPLAYETSVEFALLDTRGVIVAVNDAWLAFCQENGGNVDRCGVGTSYLDVCDSAADEGSRDVGVGIRAAIAGKRPAAIVTTISCDAPRAPRRFDVLVSSRLDDDGRCVGATVALSQVTDLTATQVHPMIETENELAAEDTDMSPGLSQAMTDDRERIASRLNNGVMSKLFSIGIGLQGMLDRLSSPEDKARILRYVDELDAVVGEVRSAVFDLGPADNREFGLKRRLLEAMDHERALHSIDISIGFLGPLDATVGRDLCDIVVDVVRGAVASVVQRSRTNTVEVFLALVDAQLVVEVADDCTVQESSTFDPDISLLARYAEQTGGTLQVTMRPTGQNVLRWSVHV